MNFSKRTAAKAAAVILSLITVLTLLPMSAAAQGATDISANGVELIKLFEGFAKKAFWDYQQWSIGYGNYCGSNPKAPDKTVTLSDGTVIDTSGEITEAEGTALIKDKIKIYVGYVNDFAKKHNRTFTQNQFDALVSFTYNMGRGWMDNDNYNITQFMSGKKSYQTQAEIDELSETFTDWCHAGGEVLAGLYNRRQTELSLFLTPDNQKYEIWQTTSTMNHRSEPTLSSKTVYGTVAVSTYLVITKGQTADSHRFAQTRYYNGNTSNVGWVAIREYDENGKRLRDFANYKSQFGSLGKPTQPTTKPTTQPTTQPTTKPTTQPTTQPTTKPTTHPTTTESNIVYPFLESKSCGDADNNGQVDISDVTLIRQHLAGQPVSMNQTNADVNRDGTVRIDDTLMIRRHLAGETVSFEKK